MDKVIFKVRPDIYVSVTQVNKEQGREGECQADIEVCVKAGKERQAAGATRGSVGWDLKCQRESSK